MTNSQALSIARHLVENVRHVRMSSDGIGPGTDELDEVLTSLQQIQVDLATGVLIYAKDGTD